MSSPAFDAVIIGAGPNGLAAGIALAREGFSVAIYEAADTVGGGVRTAELTLPGYRHDICSASHPLAIGSPYLSELPLDEHGLEWVHPPLPLAHPFDGGEAAYLARSVAETAAQFGLLRDTLRYRELIQPLADAWEKLAPDALAPLRVPRHPLLLARFGLLAMRSGRGLARSFDSKEAQGLIAGLTAHAIAPIDMPFTAAIALVLGLAGHACGWPFPRGGAQTLADAMAAYFQSLGGMLLLGEEAVHLPALPNARAYLFDTSPEAMVRIAGSELSSGYARRIRGYRHGPGVFKLDWALSKPIPWEAEPCRRAGVVHVGGTLEEITASERAMWRGQHPRRPFGLLVQHTPFDPTRAPEGKHTAWAYCHVPAHSTVDMTEALEAQVERFAPGFRDCILARHTMNTAAYELYNPNYIGGDINGGAFIPTQIFTRPIFRLRPYRTLNPRIFLCSSSTPPGGGVHGMCGYHAAQEALRVLHGDDAG